MRAVSWMLLLSLVASAAAAQDVLPQAQVTGVRGAVLCRRGDGPWAPCKLFGYVRAGDAFRIPEGAALTLFFGDGRRVVIRGSVECKLELGGVKMPPGLEGHQQVTRTPPALKVIGGSIDGLSTDQYAGITMRRPRAYFDGLLNLLGPEASLETKPRLSWTAMPGTRTYRVLVFANLTLPPLLASEVEKTSLVVPRPLERQRRYYWKVQCVGPEGTVLAEDVSDIAIVSAADAASIREAERKFRGTVRDDPGDPWPYLLLADRYHRLGLFQDEVHVCQMLSERWPDEAYPYERMAGLYSRMMYIPEADAAQARADALSKSVP